MDKVLLTRVLGVVLLIIGILGFFNNPLLGTFPVDTFNNWVYIISGVGALALSAQGDRGSENFGKAATVVYGLLTIGGFAIGSGILLGMRVNMADNILHLVLTIIFAYVGFAPHALPREKHRAAF